MSKVLFYELVSEDKGRITATHNKPELLNEEEKADGLMVDIVPEPLENGMAATLYCKPSTGELHYEYTEKQATSSEESLREKVDLMQAALDELIMSTGGGL